jgi:thiol-disulfide isomerase/thioredoxin
MLYRRCTPPLLLASILAVLFAAPTVAQSLEKGSPAPEIAGARWHNAPKDASPSLESLAGKVILLEFWGTWCGPCVRAMPRIQQLHERYAERGVVVLALSYETPEVIEPFLKKHRYTFLSGSDPEKQVIGTYHIKGWPTSVVIDAEGKIFHVGDPYGAESVLREALGLEKDAGVLLESYLDASGAKGDDARAALELLLEIATPTFDLKAWAEARGAQPLAKPPAKEPLPADALVACAKAWSKAPKDRQAALDLLGVVATAEFDLAAWAHERYGASYPLAAKEVEALLEAEKYGELASALVARRATPEVAAKALKHAGFLGFAGERAPSSRALARKAILAREWPFAGKQPKDNDAFWRDLSVSGMAMSEDKKKIAAILLDGAMVPAAGVDAYIDLQLGTALLLAALEDGKPLFGKALSAEVGKAEKAIVKEARAKYDA